MKPAEIVFDKYDRWGDYHWRYWHNLEDEKLQNGGGASYNEHIEKLLSLIKEKDILDIGCGDGLMCSLIGCKGIDTEERGIQLAKEHGQDCEIGTIYDLEKYGKFDAVLISDVIAGLSDPVEAIKQVSLITDKVYISSHFKEYWSNKDFFTIEELNKIFETSNFFPTFTEEALGRIYAIYEKCTQPM